MLTQLSDKIRFSSSSGFRQKFSVIHDALAYDHLQNNDQSLCIFQQPISDFGGSGRLRFWGTLFSYHVQQLTYLKRSFKCSIHFYLIKKYFQIR